LDNHQLPVYFFDDAVSVSSGKERQAGWAIAMREYNYRDLDAYVLKPQKQVDPFADYQAFHRAYYETVCGLFDANRGNKYSIFTINDYVASAVYDAARDRNLTIGRDVFLVGFGDYPFCKQLPVPLSSVLQKNELVGYQAAQMLYMAIIGASTGPIHRRIPTELCIRESSGVK
jgi:DNA-binding LacI/PurR family transcriptional regulator